MQTRTAGQRQASGERVAGLRRELLERELARYVRLLDGCEGLHRVIVFGSLATGETHLWSDIDLAIVQETELPFLRRSRAMRLKRFVPRGYLDIERQCRHFRRDWGVRDLLRKVGVRGGWGARRDGDKGAEGDRETEGDGPNVEHRTLNVERSMAESA